MRSLLTSAPYATCLRAPSASPVPTQSLRPCFGPNSHTSLQRYPDIQVELSMDYSLTDIVGEKFDAGVRIGEALERDMVAMRIGPDWRFCVVGSPAYFERRAPPATPYDLSNHNCIKMRLATAGGYMRWEFRSPDRSRPSPACRGTGHI